MSKLHELFAKELGEESCDDFLYNSYWDCELTDIITQRLKVRGVDVSKFVVELVFDYDKFVVTVNLYDKEDWDEPLLSVEFEIGVHLI